MNDLTIITVAYLVSDEQCTLAEETLLSLPQDVYRIGVINQATASGALDLLGSHHDKLVRNRRNSLAAGWNLGIKVGLDMGFNYFYLPNLDILLKDDSLWSLYHFTKDHQDAGITAMGMISDKHFFYALPDYAQVEKIEFSDQSFSSFMITRDAYCHIGPFDEAFEPAYFEDSDYLQRAWDLGYLPLRTTSARFWHFNQASVWHGLQTDHHRYPQYLVTNAKIFKQKHGFLPDENKWLEDHMRQSYTPNAPR